MIIGVVKEIKNNEFRVGLTPQSVAELTMRNHVVYVETGAGLGIGEDDASYIASGAKIIQSAEETFARSDMIIKVKEPLASERKMLREGQIIFTYLHLAPDKEQVADLVKSGAVCIAYETVTDDQGGLPLLRPMSEVAGRMSIQCAAWSLERSNGGLGVLIGGVSGVLPAKVVILGGGVAGFNAAQMAVGLEGDVTILDRNPRVLANLKNYFNSRARVVYSGPSIIEDLISDADVVVGSVLIPGAETPKLVTREMVSAMKPGSVLVDISIDQGGCFATSHPTTHADPIFVVDDVVHYCVANMPGAVPRTSTYALNNATHKYVCDIADKGWKRALTEDHHLKNGLNVCYGKVTNTEVAHSHDMRFFDPDELLG